MVLLDQKIWLVENALVQLFVTTSGYNSNFETAYSFPVYFNIQFKVLNFKALNYLAPIT